MEDIEMYTGESVGFSHEQETLLDKELDAKLICQRPGAKGKQLNYLKHQTVIDAANHIFGYGKWGYRVVARTIEKSYDPQGNVTGYFYSTDIELFVVGAAFPFPGDGVAPVRDYTPEGYESAKKAATTDAIKRALRHYGDQFGLCLYNEDEYVDAGDGTLIQVKDVRANGHHIQSAKKVIEAAPIRKQLPQAEEPVLTLIKVKHHALSAGVAKSKSDWQSLTAEFFGRFIPDEQLKDQPDNLLLLDEEITKRASVPVGK